MNHHLIVLTGPGNKWLKWAVRRRCKVLGTPPSPAPARTQQTCRGRKRELDAERSVVYADEHVAGTGGNGK